MRLRRLSDEKCDKDGHEEGQDTFQDGFLSQLGAKMAPVTCEKPAKTNGSIVFFRFRGFRLRSPKMATRRVKNASKTHQDAPKRRQDAPRCAQDAHKMRPRRAKMATRRRQDARKAPPSHARKKEIGAQVTHHVAKTLRDSSRRSQDAPKTRP